MNVLTPPQPIYKTTSEPRGNSPTHLIEDKKSRTILMGNLLKVSWLRSELLMKFGMDPLLHSSKSDLIWIARSKTSKSTNTGPTSAARFKIIYFFLVIVKVSVAQLVE